MKKLLSIVMVLAIMLALAGAETLTEAEDIYRPFKEKKKKCSTKTLGRKRKCRNRYDKKFS